MNKFLLLFTCVILSTGFSQSTKYGWLSKNSWSVGFGGTYPRYISTQLGVLEEKEGNNYGGFLSLQKNFSEHIGLRFLANLLHLEGYAGQTLITNNVISGNFDLLYYLIPCEPITPYFAAGLAFVSFSIENSPTAANNDSFIDYQVNLIFGGEWRLSEFLKLKTELSYNTPANGRFDGLHGEGNGLLGGRFDSYGTFNVGLLYYFAFGEKSNLCRMYEGIVDYVDYNRIEEIIKRYQVDPADIDYNRIEQMVKKHSPVSAAEKDEGEFALVGINFDFNKTEISAESLPVLYKIAEILLTHPGLKIEIQGHTDDIGTEINNQKVSLERAEVVKNFLVSKGVNENRITAVGFGETKPAVSNDNEKNRMLNRRIEFRIIK
jgi:outer membrane protein OmpA-like peptidoglycan-associated protein